MLGDIGDLNGEYVCRWIRQDGRDELIVMAGVRRSGMESSVALQRQAGDLLRQRLGVGVLVELTPPGGTAPLTQIDSRQKPIRLVDER